VAYFVIIGSLFVVALVGFVGASMALSKLADPHPRQRDLGKPVDIPPITGSLAWHVGWMPWRATTPLMQLRLYEQGILLGPRRGWLRVLGPTWALNWDDLENVRENGITLEMLTRGSQRALRFHCFSSASRRDVLAHVDGHLANATQS